MLALLPDYGEYRFIKIVADDAAVYEILVGVPVKLLPVNELFSLVRFQQCRDNGGISCLTVAALVGLGAGACQIGQRVVKINVLHHDAGVFKAGHIIRGKRERIEGGEIIDLPVAAAVAHMQGKRILAQVIAGMLKTLAYGAVVGACEHLGQIFAVIAVYLGRAPCRGNKADKLRLHLRLDAIDKRGGVQICDLDFGGCCAEALPRIA